MNPGTSWIIQLVDQYKCDETVGLVLRHGLAKPPSYVVRNNRAWCLHEQHEVPSLDVWRASYRVLGDRAQMFGLLPEETMVWEEWSND